MLPYQIMLAHIHIKKVSRRDSIRPRKMFLFKLKICRTMGDVCVCTIRPSQCGPGAHDYIHGS